MQTRLVERICDWCRERYTAKKERSKFCSSRCRVASHRARKYVDADALPAVPTAAPLEFTPPAVDIAAMAADPLLAPWAPSAAGSLDEQVQQAVVESYALMATMDRLGDEASPGLAWRCSKTGQAIRSALADNFGGIDE